MFVANVLALVFLLNLNIFIFIHCRYTNDLISAICIYKKDVQI